MADKRNKKCDPHRIKITPLLKKQADEEEDDGGKGGKDGEGDPIVTYNIEENDAMLQQLLAAFLRGKGKLGQRIMRAIERNLGAAAMAKMHPLLGKAAQFSGINRDSPDINQNPEAQQELQHKLQLQNAKKLQHAHTNAPKPTPH